jgi:signal transduction histidine kinase
LPGRSVRQELIQLCTESARGLGFDPVVRFDGPIDTAVDDDVAADLVAVAREALTNVAKHAKASSVKLSVRVHDTVLTISIVDDGVGPQDHSGAGMGLGNLAARAAARGGSSRIGRGQDGGTEVTWSVPLSLAEG